MVQDKQRNFNKKKEYNRKQEKQRMYNYQTYLKQNKLQKKFDQIRKQFTETSLQKQSTCKFIPETDPSLIHSHKKRIEGFILGMVEKPIPITPYQDLHYSPRSPPKSLSIHERSFHLNHHSDNERIEVFCSLSQDTSMKNSVFDAIPFQNTYSHRFRDFKDQSSMKPLRYKSINASLRVKEELQSSTLNYLPNLTNKKVDKLLKNPNISWKDKDYVKQINKSLLPMMHKKNYFQSLKSIFAETPHEFMKINQMNEKYEKQNQFNQPDQHNDDTDLGKTLKMEKKTSGQSVNRKQNSRVALIKCGLLGQKGKGSAYVIGMESSSKKVFPLSQTSHIRV